MLQATRNQCKGLSDTQGIVPWAELNMRARVTQSVRLLVNAGWIDLTIWLLGLNDIG